MLGSRGGRRRLGLKGKEKKEEGGERCRRRKGKAKKEEGDRERRRKRKEEIGEGEERGRKRKRKEELGKGEERERKIGSIWDPYFPADHSRKPPRSTTIKVPQLKKSCAGNLVPHHQEN